jgi:hypothetical protein
MLHVNVHGTVHRLCILKHDQQDATLYNTLYYCQRATCFERCFRSSSGVQICACSIRYLSNLLAVTASVDELSQLEVTASKFDKYLMLHVQI